MFIPFLGFDFKSHSGALDFLFMPPCDFLCAHMLDIAIPFTCLTAIPFTRLTTSGHKLSPKA